MRQDVRTREELQETVLDLDRAWQRERRLTEQYRALVDCLQIITAAQDLEGLWHGLTTRLAPTLGYSSAALVRVEHDRFRVLFATHGAGGPLEVPLGSPLRRLRKLRSLQFYDASRLPELAGLSPSEPRSVIVTEVFRGAYQLVAVFVHRDQQGFGSWHVEFLDALAASLSHSIGHLQTVSALSEAQTQLMHAERLAAIGQLAAGVAHEINNPVGFVASNFRALGDYVSDIVTLVQAYRQQRGQDSLAALEQDLDLDLDSMVADIENLLHENADGLQRVTEIVRSLRTFARLDQPADCAPNDLNAIVADTLIIANHEIRNIARIQTVFSDLPDVVCHGSQLNQVFLNILVNAAHAIRSQERLELGLITVRTGHDDAGVWCTISDDGPGIAEDVAPRVFEPFFTTRAVGEGTGLGLAIAYDIVVNKHGGTIALVPTDRGAAFVVRLPLAGTAEAAATPR
ncbi:MAG: hypothetical protein IPK64_04155 [bacterium]|nr:hypothetical protein [bacterium]